MIARFCSACGAELPRPPPVACAACGAEHWRNAKPCANAIASRPDGRILLTRRAYAPWRDLWCAPGGFCDHHERPEDAAVRETFEETGVRIRITRLLGIWVDAYADDIRDEKADWISVAYFAAEAIAEEGERDPAEVAEQRWFLPAELPGELAPPETLRAVLDVWEAHAPDGR
jgi:ADP-ribose pyrophosphatase YjhB (NUDIX family)